MPAHVTRIEERATPDVLADALNQVQWARVTGRDEVEVSLAKGGRVFLYLKPDGTWRTNGLHFLT